MGPWASCSGGSTRPYDEPEPPGGEGPPAIGARLPGEREGGPRDPSPALEDGPAPDASVAAAARDPADPDGADRGARPAARGRGAALRQEPPGPPLRPHQRAAPRRTDPGRA